MLSSGVRPSPSSSSSSSFYLFHSHNAVKIRQKNIKKTFGMKKDNKARSALTVDQYTTRHNSVNCTSIKYTLVYCIQTAEDIVKLLSRPGSPIILIFDPQCRYPIPRAKSPSAGVQNIMGGKILRLSTEIAPFISDIYEISPWSFCNVNRSHRWRIDLCRFR